MQHISTCIRSVDEFLGGGFQPGNVILIYGEAETGKTTLAMQCAVSCAIDGFKTLFVDSDRTFSEKRLSMIAIEKYDEVSEKIMLTRPVDFKEQAAVVEELSNYVSKNFKLVVFDTVTSLYSLRVAETPSKSFELNRELNRQLAILAQIARAQRIAILLTSQVHTDFDRIPVTTAPVAERVLKFWADTLVMMRLAQNPRGIEATVEKKSERLPPAPFNLRITEAGLRDNSPS